MRKYVTLSALLLSTALSSPLLAQQASNQTAPTAATKSDADVVIVTARRRGENIQDVPIAVTAFGGEALRERGVDTLDQVAKFTPNIRFDGAAALSGGNYNATVFIRGVGQNDFAIFSDPGVGIYVDDVYYARSIGGVLDAVDLASVQVLRGPQGTLFGQNTIGGAMLITTAAPDLNDFSGKVEATTGEFNRFDLKGAVNIPLIPDKLALRVSASSVNRDGYARRLIDGGQQGDRNADMVRAKLRFTPTQAVTIDLSADYTKAREGSAPNKLLAVGNEPGITGVPFLARYNAFVAPTLGITAPNGIRTLNPSFITDSPFTTFATGPNRNDLDLWGMQGVVRIDMGWAELKSVSAYRDMKAFFSRDGDGSPFVYRQTTNDDKQWQLSQELQLSGKLFGDKLSYVVGAYYMREKASDVASADLAIGLAPPLAPPGPFTPAVFVFNKTDNNSAAVFGQLDFAITDKLSLTAGLRYSKDEKEFGSRNVRQRNNEEFVNVVVNGSWDAVTPRIGVNYKVTEDILLYASYSEGYKQGGFNGRPLVAASEVTEYQPEDLETVEVGIKASLLDNTLTANLAVFSSEYKNIQLTVNQTPTNFVANAAAGEINGFELEMVARPTSWLSFNASIGNVDAKYTGVGLGLGATQILPITLASKFVKTPEWTTSAGVEIRHDFDNGAALAFRADATSYSKMFNDVANTPLVATPSYTLANARLGYMLPGGKIEIAAGVTNIEDTLYIASGNASPAFGLAEVSYGRPREWSLSVRYTY
jgi:iron complex outermembrane recepter protein